MRIMLGILLGGGIAVIGAGTGNSAGAQRPAPPTEFGTCAACHGTSKGAPNKMGPNLWGVAGSKAGQGNFSYSPALRSSNIIWDDANLDKWLSGPQKLVPGNRMPFGGVNNAAARKKIIAYLKSLK